MPPGNDEGDASSAADRQTHIQALMDSLQARSPIYGMMLGQIRLVHVARGFVLTALRLEPHHVNSKSGLHGAVSATLVDFATGLAIASWDLREATGASVDMHLSYLSTAGVGDTVEVEARAERVGGNLAFVTVRICKVLEEGEKRLVTLGQHTKFVRGSEKLRVDTS